MQHRRVKDSLYAAWAETAGALASPKRFELLDLLSQGERTVEALATEAGLSITNTSSHLKVLKGARLVDTRRKGRFIFYRLAGETVAALIRDLQQLVRQRNHEVDYLVRTWLDGRDPLEPIDSSELTRRLERGDVTLIDVRPALEYESAHIAGAISVPLPELESRLRTLPKTRLVVAYCRGPYCVFAVDAVERLRRKGYRARRFADGVTAWRHAGLPVGSGPSVQVGRTRKR
jgi:rhodanese-related sulfurtransferase